MTHKPACWTCALVFLGALWLGGCGGGDVPGGEVPASTDGIGPIRDLVAAGENALYLLDAEDDRYRSFGKDGAGARSW